ncbi:MAG: CPBP family intramembrane metalloprotease [Butyrivibrio sp.]|nr:CPBP family intramembrane metalloprotease [Butyrivibrio sp.]
MDTMKNISIKLIKDIGKIIIPLVIYYLTYFLTYIVLTTLVTKIVHLDKYIPEHEITIRGILGGISMLIGTLPLIADFRQEVRKRGEYRQNVPCRQIKTDIRKEQRVHLGDVKVALYKSVPITITLAIASSVVINFIFIRLHILETSETYSRVAEHQYGVSFIIGIILYGLVSPFAEEVVFRGIIYNKIRKDYPVVTAVILSAFLFGLYHGNIVQGAYGFLMGILIAYTYEQFGSFIHAFLFHSAANITVYMITSNEAVYNVVMTPYICVALAVIAAVMLWLMNKEKR